MIGQTADIAPADKKLYALRDVTATVESIPLITASILSKKLAEGISGLVMDVKCGRGAFMKTRADARALAESLVRVGTANGLRVSALLTAMDAPLGLSVGNALEVVESIETLKGDGPDDLTQLSVLLAARMVRLAGLADDDAEATRRVRTALDSGAGLEVFRRCIEQQGGDPRVVDDYKLLPQASTTAYVRATRRGYVGSIDAERVGVATMLLGAGRERAEDSVGHGVGVIVLTKPGELAKPDEPIFEVIYRDGAKLAAAVPLLEGAFTLADAPPPEQPLVLEEVA
jgi:pyrimidine-nucleoside phosphorylase